SDLTGVVTVSMNNMQSTSTNTDTVDISGVAYSTFTGNQISNTGPSGGSALSVQDGGLTMSDNVLQSQGGSPTVTINSGSATLTGNVISNTGPSGGSALLVANGTLTLSANTLQSQSVNASTVLITTQGVYSAITGNQIINSGNGGTS